MTDAVSNTDDIEPAEGGAIIDGDAAAPASEPDLEGPLEGIGEPDEDGDTDETLSDPADQASDDVADQASDDSSDDEAFPDGTAAATEDNGRSQDEGDAEALAMQTKFDELNDRHLRLAAEFNNFRRRTEQQRLESWTRAQADLVEKFLDVLDDLHRVADLDLSNTTVEGIMEGIDLVEKKFVRVVADTGMEMIDPVGEAFDPERMEAMMRVPTENEEEDDVVAQVFQKGYTLKGILVRPARVSVHKHG
jgi:molecular chaperone GrpE